MDIQYRFCHDSNKDTTRVSRISPTPEKSYGYRSYHVKPEKKSSKPSKKVNNTIPPTKNKNYKKEKLITDIPYAGFAAPLASKPEPRKPRVVHSPPPSPKPQTPKVERPQVKVEDFEPIDNGQESTRGDLLAPAETGNNGYWPPIIHVKEDKVGDLMKDPEPAVSPSFDRSSLLYDPIWSPRELTPRREFVTLKHVCKLSTDPNRDRTTCCCTIHTAFSLFRVQHPPQGRESRIILILEKRTMGNPKYGCHTQTQ